MPTDRLRDPVPPPSPTGARRDGQRQATYDAEAAAFEGTVLEEPIGLYHCTRLVDALARTPWWRSQVRRPPPALREARADARRSSARRATWEVRFARGHDSVVTLAHELAHLLTDGGHDDRFRRGELDLLALLAGPEAAARLATAFARAGLAVAPSPAPIPSDAPEGGLVAAFGDVFPVVDADSRRHAVRIAKLLAKAASTTDAEAEALTSKALELSVRYGIDRALLAAAEDGGDDDIVERRVLLTTGPYVAARWRLLALVAHHLGCEAFYRAGRTGRVVSVVGFRSDVDQVLELFGGLDHQAAVGALAVRSRRSTAKARREFLHGFVAGVADQLARAEARAGLDDRSTPAALVLVERRRTVADHVARTYHLRTERSGWVEPSDAFAAGVAAGADAAVPRPRLAPAVAALDRAR